MSALVHSHALTGFADIEDGITIDLSAMKAVKLNRSSSIVAVGAGARWQNVYDALDPYSVSVQGGRNGDVGVGGFLIGGIHSCHRLLHFIHR